MTNAQHAASGPLDFLTDFPDEHRPGRGDYVATFLNSYGDRLVFIATPGVRTATLYHSDRGWEAEPIEGGLSTGLFFDREEAAFVAACWRASAALRHSTTESLAVRTALGGEPTVLISLQAVTGYGTCDRCAQAIIFDLRGACTHATPQGTFGSRGCRAASFDRLGTWDDDLPKSWSAEGTPT